MGTRAIAGVILLIFDITRQRDSNNVKQYSENYTFRAEWSISFIVVFLWPEEIQIFHFPNPDELPFFISSASLTD